MKTRDLTKISICVAIICIASYISFPIPLTPVMITGQTIAINLIALILTPKQSTITLLVYILLGAIGIPVYAGGGSGFGALFGPTGGFILGFLIIAPLMSYLKGKENSLKRYLVVTIFGGMLGLYIIGTIYLSIYLKIGIIAALTMAVFPFIIGDIIKCFISSFLALKLNKILFRL